MDFKHLFLSYQGRIRRLHFWIGMIILWVVEMIIVGVFGGGITAAAASGDPNAMTAAMSGAGLIVGLLCLALLWPAFAIYTKRWHDRNKSGWWSLILIIPFLGALWVLIELGFIDGTPGENKYGPSPKGVGAPTPAPAA